MSSEDSLDVDASGEANIGTDRYGILSRNFILVILFTAEVPSRVGDFYFFILAVSLLRIFNDNRIVLMKL